MQSIQERGRPIWFNQMEQHLMYECLQHVLAKHDGISTSDRMIIVKTRDKLARYLNKPVRTSNGNKEE